MVITNGNVTADYLYYRWWWREKGGIGGGGGGGAAVERSPINH